VRKRRLGGTGIEVGVLGLGGAFVTARVSDYEQSWAAIYRAVELGVDYVDTAPGYSNSEEVLGRALEDVDAPLVVSTKLGGRPAPFDPRDASHLRRSVEESLRLLKRDAIDVLFIHEPERPGHYAFLGTARTASQVR
jgi:aryl-alcohol dehydrogenase-like predicted oxidoreductase